MTIPKTNMEEKINTQETVSQPSVKSKKRRYTDIPLLVFIVFLSLSVMFGLSLAKPSEEASSAVEEEQFVVLDTSESNYVVGNNEKNVALADNTVKEEDPFVKAFTNVAYMENAGNTIYITYNDGSKGTYGGGNTVVNSGVIDFDEDKEFGAVPIDEDSAVKNAINNKAAYAARTENSGSFGSLALYSSGKTQSSSGGSSSSSDSCGKNGSCESDAVFYWTLNSNSTWYRLLAGSKSVSYTLSFTPDGKTYGCHCTTGPSTTDGNNTSASGTINSSSNIYFVFHAYSSASGSCKSGASCSSSVSNCKVTLTHKNTFQPDYSPKNPSMQDWKTNRKITITLSDTSAYLYQAYIGYYSSATSSISYTSKATGINKDKQDFSQTTYGGATYYAKNYIDRVREGTFTATQLKIDNEEPIISDIWIADTKGNRITSYVNNSSLRVYVSAYDSDLSTKNGAASGISSVVFGKVDGGVPEQSATSNNPTTSGTTTLTAYLDIDGAKANGEWKVTVTDYAGNSGTGYFKFDKYDGKKPDIDSLTFSVIDDSSVTQDSKTWTSQPILAKFTITDNTGSNDKSKYFGAIIESVKVTFTYNGTSYELSENNGLVKEGTADSIPNKKSFYSCYIPYDLNATGGGFTIAAKDHVGEATKKVTTQECSYRIDTVAPQITIEGTSDGTSALATSSVDQSKYVSSDIALTIKAQDYSYDTTGTGVYYSKGSGYKYNNGSGIKYLRFYSDAAMTKNAIVTINGTEYTGEYKLPTSLGDTNAKTVTVTIKSDTTQLAAIYVVAEDWCGNRSNGKGNTGDGDYRKTSYNRTWSGNNNQTTGTSGYYYIYPSKLYEGRKIWRDTYKPQIVVYNSDDEVIAATNAYKGMSLNYTFKYSNVQAQKIRIEAYFGCSGGKLSINQGSANVSNTSFGATPSGLEPITLPATASSGSPNSSYSNTGSASYSGYRFIVESKSFTSEGSLSYNISFTSGNEKMQSSQVTIVTQMDRTAPTITLEGFSTGSVLNETAFTDFKNGSGKIDEKSLLDKTQWNDGNGGNGLYAVFTIVDSYSGVVAYAGSNLGGTSKTYGKDGTAESYSATDYTANYSGGVNGSLSSNDSGYYFSFRYTNGERTYYTNEYVTDSLGRKCYATKCGTNYVVCVKLFDREAYAKLTSGGTKFCVGNASTGVWDIVTGTFLTYSFGASDFLGNSVTYASPKVREEFGGSGSTLKYYADPFPVSATVNFFTCPATMWDTKKDKATASAAGFAAYTMAVNSADSDGWTKDYVIAEVTKRNGLSQTDTSWGVWDMNVNSKELATADGFTYNNSTASEVIHKNATLDWIIFDNTSKNIQFGIKVASKTNKECYFESGNQFGKTFWYIKQDATDPIIEKVFVAISEVTSADDVNVMLCFDAQVDNNGNYKYTLDKSRSHGYIEGEPYAWSTKNVYVYIQATDQLGELSGSGVKSVSFNGIDCGDPVVSEIRNTINKNGRDIVVISKLFRTTVTYGYGAKRAVDTYSLVVKDAMDNSITTIYGGNDTTGYRMLPLVDDVTDYCIYVTGSSVANSIVNTLNKDSEGHDILMLNGEPSKTSNNTITFTYRTGISGMKLYIRERKYGESLENNTQYIELEPYKNVIGKENNGNKILTQIPVGYDYAAQGWGKYTGETWTSGINSYMKSFTSGDTQTKDDLKALNTDITLNLTSVKSRFDVLMVNGTGTYYLLELGDLFVDTKSPVIDDNMTIFASASAAGIASNEIEGEINYSDLQTLWTNVVGDSYTNGNVYIYYQINDTASGVDDQKVVHGSEKLERITVLGVPVFVLTVDGKKYVTNVRDFGGNIIPTVTVEGGYYVINGIKSNVKNVGTAICSIEYKDIIYYRLLATIPTVYTIQAYDIAGNNPTSSTAYDIKIDKMPVTVSLVSCIDGEYTNGGNAEFTNKDITAIWTIDYGNSGFGYLSYTKENNDGNVLTRNNTNAMPEITVQGGKLVLNYLDGNGVLQTYNTGLIKQDKVTVSANGNNWQVQSIKVVGATETPTTVITPIEISGSYSIYNKAVWTKDYTNGTITLADSNATLGIAKNVYNALDIAKISYETINGIEKVQLTYKKENGTEVLLNTGITAKTVSMTDLTKCATLDVVNVDGVYYWRINGTATNAKVASSYQSYVMGVKWIITGSSSVMGKIAVVTGYSENYTEIRIPKISFSANRKVVITFVNASNVPEVYETSVVKPADEKVSLRACYVAGKYYWEVNGVNTGRIVTSYYGNAVNGIVFNVDVANTKMTCTFIIPSEDQSVTYTVKAYNGIGSEYAVSTFETGISMSQPELPRIQESDGKITLVYIEHDGTKYAEKSTKTNISAENVHEVTLSVKKIDAVDKWHINGTNTGITVSPYYPTSITAYTWQIGFDNSKVEVNSLDWQSISTATQSNLPLITANGENKLVLLHMTKQNVSDPDYTEVAAVTSINTPNTRDVTLAVKELDESGAKVNYWFINNTNTGVKVSKYYDAYVAGKIKSWNVIWDTFSDYKSVTNTINRKIAYGTSGLSYIDYNVVNSTNNVFATVNKPTLSFDEYNRIIFNYKDVNSIDQKLYTGIAATVNVKISVTTVNGEKYWRINNQTIQAKVNTTYYTNNVSNLVWTYNLNNNTVTLEDTANSGNTVSGIIPYGISFDGSGKAIIIDYKLPNGTSVSVNTGINKAQNGITTLTFNNGRVFVNGMATTIPVYNEKLYSVTYSLDGSVVNQLKVYVTDIMSNVTYKLRAPVVSNDGGKIALTVLDGENKEIRYVTDVSMPADNLVLVVANGQYWSVNGVSTSLSVASAYINNIVTGIRWIIDVENKTAMLSFDSVKNNKYVYHKLTAYNGQKTNNIADDRRPVSEEMGMIVNMDVMAPVIDISFGNVEELNATDVWHYLAKSLRVGVYDTLSGIGESNVASNSEGDNYEDVILRYKLADGMTPGIAYLVKCEDGLYRAYNAVAQVDKETGMTYYKQDTLFKLDRYTEYTIEVKDKAGNKSTYVVKPQIDTVNATISDMKIYKHDGAIYEQNEENAMTDWSTINWASNYLKITMNVTYGASGYALEYYTDYRESKLGTNSATWAKLATNKYTVTSTKTNDDGTKTDSIEIKLGEDIDYMYCYYMFRAMSNAQYTEKDKYKKYNDSTQNRAVLTNVIDNDVITGFQLIIDLEKYEYYTDGASNVIKQATCDLGAPIKTVLLAMDKTVPTITVNAKKGAENYGSGSGSQWNIGANEWSKDSVVMNVLLASDSTYISGNAFYYRSYEKKADGSWIWSEWKRYLPGESTNLSITIGRTERYYQYMSADNKLTADKSCLISYYAATLSYVLKSSCDNVVYEFYTETGAGLRSATGRIGNADTKVGIKIDTIQPKVTLAGKSTNDKFTSNGMDAQEELKTAYGKGSSYTVTNAATFTMNNTVIVNLAIGEVGYSGVKVFVGGALFDTITYAKYLNERVGNSSTIYRYYYVSKDGESNIAVRIESIAGKEVESSFTVKIDNTTPIMYVTDISGTKAANWGQNNNAYADKENTTATPEFWYVSKTDIAFGIGKVLDGAFVNAVPSSGYIIEYTKNNGQTWMVLAGTELSIEGKNIVEGDVYRFRIKTNAGITYALGGVIVNNVGESAFNGNINDAIATVTSINAISGHVINGNDGDYDDGSYNYKFFVDSNEYAFNYSGELLVSQDSDGGNKIYNTNTNEFVDYDVYKVNANGNYVEFVKDEYNNNTTTPIPIADTSKFHHGDYIKLVYTAKYDGTEKAVNPASYNYFQNYTESKSGDQVKVYCENADNEREGAIRFLFGANNIITKADFIAEVEVDYGTVNTQGKDIFYLQADDGLNRSTGFASYNYLDGSTVKTIAVSLEYSYYKIDGTPVTDTSEVGAYYVITSVKPNTGRFRVTNEASENTATDRKEFVVKYFVLNTETNDFIVNNAEDFGYIDKNYYDMKADGTVDMTTKTYLAGKYRVVADLTLNSGLSGNFTGIFNGMNHVISLVGGTVNTDYGIFDTISGTVYAVNAKTTSALNINANEAINVGLLARTLKGEIYDVTVVTDMTIEKVTNGANIGGLVAVSTSGATIGKRGSIVYSDVRITNGDNNISVGNISPLIGYMKLGTVINSVYSFGSVDLFNVGTTVKAGIVFGNADSGSYDVDDLNYYANNVYVNGEEIDGLSNITNIAAVNLGENFGGTNYSDFIGDTIVAAGSDMVVAYLTRLYSDFGYTYTEDKIYGTGSSDDPLIISTQEHFNSIGNYTNLNYAVAASVTEIDMSSFATPIAERRIFNGYITTENGALVELINFAGNISTYDKEYFGLIGRLNGAVSNLVFSSLAIDFVYNGTADTLYAGLVAARTYENANINNIILIGTTKITAINKTAYVGGIAGTLAGGTITDVFNINNLSVNARSVIAGGITGLASVSDGNAPKLPNAPQEGAIYLFGRVEGNGQSVVVGGAIGTGTINEDSASEVYVIANNAYSNTRILEAKPIGSTVSTYGINVVELDNASMRETSFASGKNAFNLVFGGYYPLIGLGTSNSPFIVNDEADFKNIDIALYATYTIMGDIVFTDFKTIGDGLVFSGTIKGSGGSNISAEENSIASLSNLNAPLVYYNAGSITDLVINIEYEKTVASGEEFYFGAVAIYSSGTIKNVTAVGSVNITSEKPNTTIYASGFVAVSYGGAIEPAQSKIQNSISALNIHVTGGGIAYIGGYAAKIEQGEAKFSYGIATGTITVDNVQTVYAGFLVGLCTNTSTWNIGDGNGDSSQSKEYTYTIIINGEELPKVDENDNQINLCGLQISEANGN